MNGVERKSPLVKIDEMSAVPPGRNDGYVATGDGVGSLNPLPVLGKCAGFLDVMMVSIGATVPLKGKEGLPFAVGFARVVGGGGIIGATSGS
jgi:hypothetical protein